MYGFLFFPSVPITLDYQTSIFSEKKHAYPLSGIKEIIFESGGKGPYRLRLITRDYQTKIYVASTLKTKTWLKLKKGLEQMEVQVRNETIPEG